MIKNMFRPAYIPNAVGIRHLTVKTGPETGEAWDDHKLREKAETYYGIMLKPRMSEVMWCNSLIYGEIIYLKLFIWLYGLLG